MQYDQREAAEGEIQVTRQVALNFKVVLVLFSASLYYI